MLVLWSPLVELLEGVKMLPSQVPQTLPNSDCEVVELDVEGWDGGFLVHGLRRAVVVPPDV